jgi:predicted RNA-binding protein with PIN domain
MPYLIDGNNLMHAAAERGLPADRLGLCEVLAELLLRAGERVAVIFDGPEPSASEARAIDRTGIEVAYSGHKAADRLILAAIGADTAPRRLTVVSTDREIRSAARKRRCRCVTSEDFAVELRRSRNGDPPSDKSSEPDEKRQGLSEEQTRKWLEEFGFDR